MNEVITIGLDLAKNVFQIRGVDGLGEVAIRRQLRRNQMIPYFEKLPPCLIGVEACPTSHYWSRELQELGHEVRIIARPGRDRRCPGRSNQAPNL